MSEEINLPRRIGATARLGVVALALVGASCVAVDSSGALASRAAKSVVISTSKNATYGTILVSGNTVYTLRPSSVACTAACLKVWPEVLLAKGVSRAVAGQGVKAASLGSVARPGGLRQVTYNGKALYWFYKDKAPGQVKGNATDKWGKWSVVVTVKPPGSGTTTTTGNPGTGGTAF